VLTAEFSTSNGRGRWQWRWWAAI